jgi:hypothetical protein
MSNHQSYFPESKGPDHQPRWVAPIAIMEENTAPRHLAFNGTNAVVAPLEFRAGVHEPVAARADSLESLVATVASVDVASLEFTVYSHALENWVSEHYPNDILTHEVRGVRALGKHGEALRVLLFTLIQERLGSKATAG